VKQAFKIKKTGIPKKGIPVILLHVDNIESPRTNRIDYLQVFFSEKLNPPTFSKCRVNKGPNYSEMN
jgi:hypothetical protein